MPGAIFDDGAIGESEATGDIDWVFALEALFVELLEFVDDWQAKMAAEKLSNNKRKIILNI